MIDSLILELKRAQDVIDKLQAEIQRNNLHDKIEWPFLFHDTRRKAIAQAENKHDLTD